MVSNYKIKSVKVYDMKVKFKEPLRVDVYSYFKVVSRYPPFIRLTFMVTNDEFNLHASSFYFKIAKSYMENMICEILEDHAFALDDELTKGGKEYKDYLLSLIEIEE